MELSTNTPAATPIIKYWDPDGTTLDQNKSYGARKIIAEKYAKYQINPGLPRRNLLLACIPGAIEIILLLLNPNMAIKLIESDARVVFVLILPFFLPAWYWFKILKLQQDLVKMLIAKEYNWLYSPDEDSQHWTRLARKYPIFFDKGNAGQNMQDEFWGVFKGDKQAVNFYSGIFEYKVESRNSYSRGTGVLMGSSGFGPKSIGGMGKNSQKYRKTVFSIQLNKPIKVDFRLEPEGVMQKFLNLFRSKEIDTESAEFNRSFAVYYAGQRVEKELEIVKTLSPAVQLRLVELKKQKGNFGVLFNGDVAIFIFERDLFRNMKTNFFKKVELDPRDREEIGGTLSTVLEISAEIVPYLD